MKTPTERFSDRVANYVRYRPAYPEAVIDALIETCHLDSKSVIADVGSGTGIFTQQLLDQNMRVMGVEPNLEMREAAESTLSSYPHFTSIDGSAEALGLPDQSVDLIVSAQAFHWFELTPTQIEFAPVLKKPQWVALIWNQRKMTHPFQKAYETMLQDHAPQYSQVNHMNLSDEAIAQFFDARDYQVLTFDNAQVFDKEGFLGRMHSSSYVPKMGTPQCTQLIALAEKLFDAYQTGGLVSFEYDTHLYTGHLHSCP